MEINIYEQEPSTQNKTNHLVHFAKNIAHVLYPLELEKS